MLIIRVGDPQEYIGRGGPPRRALDRADYGMVGSPVAISSTTLETGFPEPVALFERYRREYGRRADI